MKPILKVVLLISTFLLYIGVNAQISDSLYKVLPLTVKPINPKLLTDEEKRILLDSVNAIPHRYIKEITELAQQLILATEKKADQNSKIHNISSIATFYYVLSLGEIGDLSKYIKSNQEKAVYYSRKLIAAIANNPIYKRDASQAYRHIGVIYFRKNMFDSCVIYCYKCLDICKQQNDTARLFEGYSLLGDTYFVMNLIENALCTNNIALEISKRWSNKYLERYFFKMRCYTKLYTSTRIERYADSAMDIASTMFKNADKNFDNFGGIYLETGKLYYTKGNYKKALEYIDTGLMEKWWKSGTQFAVMRVAHFYKNICLIRYNYPELAKRVLDSLPLNSYEYRQLIYEALYLQASDTRNWQKAFNYYHDYITNLDSMKITETRSVLFEAEQKYAAAEKQAQITALVNKNLLKGKEQSKLVSIGVSAGLVLLLTIAILLGMYRYAQVKRYSEKQLLTAQLYSMEAAIHAEHLQHEEKISAQRKKIAEDMHDEVSSGLAAFKYYIADLKAKAGNEETTKVLGDLEAEAHTLYQQARNFMHNLNASKPSGSYDVYALAEQLSTRFNNEKVLTIKNEIDRTGIEQYFTGTMHYELYLVIKEAVANSIKHAGANLVNIGIYFKNHTCFFAIRDNGRGFNVQAVQGGGLGLNSITSRIQTINGKIKIHSDTNGTVVEGYFPV